MDMLIRMPALALIPLGLYLGLHLWSHRPMALFTALAWGGYALYEYGVKLRLLCSGECNIRVDLLLIYPVLLILSLAALIAVLRSRPGSRQ